ncbi:condensation domain-containing protein, partial [Streptomyces sp. NPDC051909]|uniref:condensation domain-containing protein n=1 Tax=Streptomyces sp. NPDC051909 TaxID=3154944 RepID=UPI00343427B5
PTHSTPTTYTHLTVIPLTPNGKTDTTALPTPQQGRDVALGPVVEPGSALEGELAELWREILGLERVSVRDGFLALGGNSLGAVHIASRVAQRYGIRLSVDAILSQGTIADLACRIETAGCRDVAVEPLERVGRCGPLPATVAQQGLWFIEQAHSGRPVYNEVITLRLSGPLDAQVLRQCLHQLVARHEPLRTALSMIDGRLCQQIHRVGETALSEWDVSWLTDDGRQEAIERLVRQTAGRRIDLEVGPFLRAHLVRMSADEHVLLLSMHHTAMDGWSVKVLFADLATLYPAVKNGLTAEQPSPGAQFADFAALQHSELANGAYDESIAYWRHQLADVPQSLQLPTNLPRPDQPSGNGALARTLIPAPVMAEVDQLARATSTTRYMVLLAAFQTLLSRYTAREDILVGTPASGRPHPDLDHTVGYFISMLPLRARISPDTTFRQLLQQVRDTVVQAYAHQLPFPRLLEECGVRAESLTPLVQVAMVPQDAYPQAFQIDELHATVEYPDPGIAKHDLTLLPIPDAADNGLHVHAEYRTDLFEPDQVERLLGHLCALLQSALGRPDVPMAALTMLTDAEEHNLSAGWHGRSLQQDDSLSALAIVDRQAASRPSSVLVMDGQTSLTYSELVMRANRLAHYLLRRGVEHGDRVGVCLPRSVEALIAFLAVWKAGAAYVPLDPAYPVTRLAFIAEDSGVALTLTQELLSQDEQVIASCPTHDPGVQVGGSDLAYVMYTSGSTGQPKGVQVEHRSI